MNAPEAPMPKKLDLLTSSSCISTPEVKPTIGHEDSTSNRGVRCARGGEFSETPRSLNGSPALNPTAGRQARMSACRLQEPKAPGVVGVVGCESLEYASRSVSCSFRMGCATSFSATEAHLTALPLEDLSSHILNPLFRPEQQERFLQAYRSYLLNKWVEARYIVTEKLKELKESCIERDWYLILKLLLSEDKPYKGGHIWLLTGEFPLQSNERLVLEVGHAVRSALVYRGLGKTNTADADMLAWRTEREGRLANLLVVTENRLDEARQRRTLYDFEVIYYLFKAKLYLQLVFPQFRAGVRSEFGVSRVTLDAAMNVDDFCAEIHPKGFIDSKKGPIDLHLLPEPVEEANWRHLGSGAIFRMAPMWDVLIQQKRVDLLLLMLKPFCDIGWISDLMCYGNSPHEYIKKVQNICQSRYQLAKCQLLELWYLRQLPHDKNLGSQFGPEILGPIFQSVGDAVSLAFLKLTTAKQLQYNRQMQHILETQVFAKHNSNRELAVEAYYYEVGLRTENSTPFHVAGFVEALCKLEVGESRRLSRLSKEFTGANTSSIFARFSSVLDMAKLGDASNKSEPKILDAFRRVATVLLYFQDMCTTHEQDRYLIEPLYNDILEFHDAVCLHIMGACDGDRLGGGTGQGWGGHNLFSITALVKALELFKPYVEAAQESKYFLNQHPRPKSDSAAIAIEGPYGPPCAYWYHLASAKQVEADLRPMPESAAFYNEADELLEKAWKVFYEEAGQHMLKHSADARQWAFDVCCRGLSVCRYLPDKSENVVEQSYWRYSQCIRQYYDDETNLMNEYELRRCFKNGSSGQLPTKELRLRWLNETTKRYYPEKRLQRITEFQTWWVQTEEEIRRRRLTLEL